MKNRIATIKAVEPLKAKPLSPQAIIGEYQFAPIADEEFEGITEAVPPAKRMKLSVDLSLTPLQVRALAWMAYWAGVTIEEFVAQALVVDLDGVNNTDRTSYYACLYGSVVDLFPERKKQLGEVCRTFNTALSVQRHAGKLRVAAMEASYGAVAV